MRNTFGTLIMRLPLTVMFVHGAIAAEAEEAKSSTSGASTELIQGLVNQLTTIHKQIESQLARLVPVTMSVTPELAMVGEEVALNIEALDMAK